MTLTDDLLGPILTADPAAPRITFYDDATGERIELSGVTLANWAAKTANFLRDEFMLSTDDKVAVLLPAHWQTAAVLLGSWWAGCEVVLAAEEDADLTFATSDTVAAAGTDGELVVLSLDPFGRPVPDLPPGATDYASSVRVHGDQYRSYETPSGPVLAGLTAQEVLSRAQAGAAGRGWVATDRILSTLDWTDAEDMITGFISILAVSASLVQVANLDPRALERRIATEKVTHTLDKQA
ncbi:TIGR03089 family protein [Hoyosella altamirensis]|uniref:Uncharacterized protein (TIGR03089 family) n=1 Tax=Hoyosella altamirensis TaxID=616997 RepID=A0A839RHA1_9ACTN|nr:TIGR03089 family protein [Hoyosella altamirensis]MBB3035618.1 uncharacterized protein (TIGR03089 family) [Hoyosella altamirensis]